MSTNSVAFKTDGDDLMVHYRINDGVKMMERALADCGKPNDGESVHNAFECVIDSVFDDLFKRGAFFECFMASKVSEPFCPHCGKSLVFNGIEQVMGSYLTVSVNGKASFNKHVGEQYLCNFCGAELDLDKLGIEII